jgi:hypothetical protein
VYILDTTTRSLEFLLGGVPTNQLPFVADFADVTTTTFTPGSNNGVSNSTTAVTLIAAPAASTQRQIKSIGIENADTAVATVTVRYNDNATLRNLLVTNLQPGDTLQYNDAEGWSVLTKSGERKVTAVGSDMIASGTLHAHGLAPDPGAVAGTTKFLREDATWQVPAGGGGAPTFLSIRKWGR